MNKVILLMTASVSTRGMRGGCFSNEERESMYVATLAYYIEHILKKDQYRQIVFAENSGWNIENLKAKLPIFDKNKIEFVSLNPDEFDLSKGKGFNEMLMINKALEISEFLKKSSYFFKVTGRYPIYNLNYFLKKADKILGYQGFDMYCDIKDHRLYDWFMPGWSGHSFECRLFGVKKTFYQIEIAPLYSSCNDYDGSFMEDVMFAFVKACKGNIKLRFKREAYLGGVEGSDSTALSFSKNQDSWKGNMKRMIGNFIRIFLPFFYF